MMKRILFSAFLLLSLLLFSSCRSEKNVTPPSSFSDLQPENFVYTAADDKPYPYNCADGTVRLQYDSGFLYFLNGAEAWGSTVCRLNPETGFCSSVCSDPFCEHDTPDCPFFGLVGMFYVHDGTVIYDRVFKYTERNLDGSIRKNWDVAETAAYDAASAKVKILNPIERSRTTFLQQLFSGRDRYYYDYVRAEDSDDFALRICRQDLDTGKTTVIGGEENQNGVVEQVVFALNDRLYFTDGKRLYSRNRDNADEIVHCTGRFGETVLTDGEFVYFELYEDGKKNVYRLSDWNDYGSAEKVISDCAAWKLTEHWLYYMDNAERVIGKSKVSGYAGEKIVLSGNCIRRCGHNGENDEVVFTFEDAYRNHQLYSMIVFDNYIYGFDQYWEDSDGDGVFRDGDMHDDFSIMRIDITDGSVYTFRDFQQ